MKVEAVDRDAGHNGHISYHLRVGERNVQLTEEFQLDKMTGELRTRRVLDREIQPAYHVSYYLNYLQEKSVKEQML